MIHLIMEAIGWFGSLITLAIGFAWISQLDFRRPKVVTGDDIGLDDEDYTSIHDQNFD